MNFKSDSEAVEVILYGGLGNQLFQYSAALSAAIELGLKVRVSLVGESRSFNKELPDLLGYRLPLLLEYSNVDKKQSALEKKAIRILLMISSSENPTLLFVKGRSLMSYFIKLFLKIRCGLQISFPHGLGFDPDFVCNYSQSSLLGNFHSYRWISPAAKKILLNELKLAKTNSQIDEYMKLAQDEKPIAVHVRLGDYLDLDELNVITKDYYGRALDYLNALGDNREIWIFTNDEDNFKSYLPAEFENNIRIISSLLSPSETLEVMRLCDNHVISNSTFSWWGAFLGRNPHGTVIAPRSWFKNRKDPQDICPPDWVRL